LNQKLPSLENAILAAGDTTKWLPSASQLLKKFNLPRLQYFLYFISKFPIMTTKIYNLNMMDTEYAALVAKSYDPIIEQQIIALEQNPNDDRDMARFMGLITKATPRNDAEWEEFNTAWVNICNVHGCDALALDFFPLMAAWDDVDWM
jgi:hypothetical protein